MYNDEALRRKIAKEGKGKFIQEIKMNLCSKATKAIYEEMDIINFAGNINEVKLNSL